MKLPRIVSAAAILAVFLIPAPASSQQQRQGEKQDKAKQQERQGKSDKRTENDKQRAKPREPQRGEAAKPQPREQPSARGGQQSSPSRERPQVSPRERGSQSPPPPPPPRARTQSLPERAVPRSEARYPREQRTEQQARAWQQERGWQRPGVWQAHDTWGQHRALRWDRDHRTWLQRGGYGGYYIPADHFRLYFGAGRYFRLRTRPTIVMGYPRFQYRGYWFMLVDPWPERWAADWYATDDLFIDYDDGYYLHNRRQPGVAIAIAVVF
jgi:hypothetical protein